VSRIESRKASGRRQDGWDLSVYLKGWGVE
jgi:hypothetical protein